MLSIGDIAEKVSLNPSTLRYYEKMNLIPKQLRIGGQRRYEFNVIGRIELIKIARNYSLKPPTAAVLPKSERLAQRL
jgi:DNA-binding transcriptional MerR regulator